MPEPEALEFFLSMEKFPLRVAHRPCEPLHALFARTVERNLHGEVSPYAAALGVPRTRRVANLPVEEVARLCGADPSRLAHASPSFDGNHTWLMGQRLHRGDMAFERRRWCPDCLRETGVHHAWWDIAAVTTCPEHSCALVESCICGMSVTWRNAGFYNCACGRVLARVPAKRLPASECVADAYIIGRLASEPSSRPGMLDLLPLDEAVSTMEAVGRFVFDPHSEGLPTGIHRREILCAGYAAISEPWAGFASALEDAERHRPSASGFTAPVYSDEFRHWLVHGQPDVLDGNVSWFFGPARAEPPGGNGAVPYGHFTYQEADQMCCVPHGTVKAIVRQRQVKARMGCLPLPSSVDPDFVRSLAKDLAFGKSITEVARELGIRPAEVRELVRRQQLLTVVDEEPGLRCVIRGDAVQVLSRSNGAGHPQFDGRCTANL